MRTFLRVLLLCAVTATGVGIAVSIASFLPDSYLPNSPGGLPVQFGNDSQTPQVPPGQREFVDNTPSVIRNTSPRAIAEPPPLSSQPNLPIQVVQPQPMPYEPPVASKVDQLEMKLDLMNQAARRDQILRLESKLNQLEQAANENRRQFQLAADEQRRRFDDAARRQQEMFDKFAQSVVHPRFQARVEPNTVAAIQPPASTTTQNNAAQSNVATRTSTQIDSTAVQESVGDESQDQPGGIHPAEGDDSLSLNLEAEDLRSVLEFLSRDASLNILSMPSVSGTVTASLVNVDVRTALEAILKSTGFVAREEGGFIYVGTPEDFERMDQNGDRLATRVYRTDYVSAAELQQLITPLLTENVGFVTVSTPSQVDIPNDEIKTGGDDFAGNEVIVVRDYAAVLSEIDDLVKHIDQRPRQVSIEAMIVSVNLDDAYNMGVDFEFLKAHNNIRVVGNSPLVSLGSIDTTGDGLHFGFLDSDVSGFVEALESFGDTDVVASPHLVCLNKQRAEILIGDQKGYISTTQTETATTQTVEFLDIGTKLRIRPFISADGMIRLEVHPELSTGDVRLLGGFALPEKNTTQVTTNIMCRDGATVVIGGLIKEDIAKSLSQVPVVGNIPLLGGMFRKWNETTTRNEIIVLITPRIIYDPAACQSSDECLSSISHRRATTEANNMTTIGRKHYSDRYYRLAEQAYRAANYDAALEYLNLSLQFNLENELALKLRSKLICHCDPPAAAGSHEMNPAERIQIPVPLYEPPSSFAPIEELPSGEPPADSAALDPPTPDAITTRFVAHEREFDQTELDDAPIQLRTPLLNRAVDENSLSSSVDAPAPKELRYLKSFQQQSETQ